MVILGINAFHADASACLVVDGRVVAAAEEERFRRVKHWAGLPTEAVRFCLEAGGISLDQVAILAVNSDASANRLRKLGQVMRSRPSLSLLRSKIGNRSRRKSALHQLSDVLGQDVGTVRQLNLEHHLCHLASAFYPSGFERALAVSVDGFGDFSSAATGVASSDGIEVDRYVHVPHSLGVFYQAITQYLQFPNYGDEYKVMGLASYGTPRYLDELSQVLHSTEGGEFRLDLAFFRHHVENVSTTWDGGTPTFSALYSARLEALLGPPRAGDEAISDVHRDIAASAQALYERSLFSLLNAAHQRHPEPCLVLAGGCAMNSVANGKILANTGFEKVYVQPAAGDAGGALGAALQAWRQQVGPVPGDCMPHAYLGPAYDNDTIARAIAKAIAVRTTADLDEDVTSGRLEQAAMLERVVDCLVDGGVVGWFQGAMEWGPRALGNRSILADPRRDDIQDLLNAKIKRRESFRPFAPSVLEEQAAEWFESPDAVPFMEKVYPVRAEKRARVPAITHVDGSGRLQTVSGATNPLYHRLLTRFFERTGVPMLLNTSFNENEPIVCTPDQALDCFLRTRMDLLVMGEHFVARAENDLSLPLPGGAARADAQRTGGAGNG